MQRRQIGLAEAEAILAKGEAEAEARRKLAEALKLYNEAGLSIEALKVLPEIAAAVSEPLARAGETTIISNGGNPGDGTGAARLTDDVIQVLSQLGPVMKQLSGVDLDNLLQNISRLPGAVADKRRRAASQEGPRKRLRQGFRDRLARNERRSASSTRLFFELQTARSPLSQQARMPELVRAWRDPSRARPDRPPTARDGENRHAGFDGAEEIWPGLEWFGASGAGGWRRPCLLRVLANARSTDGAGGGRAALRECGTPLQRDEAVDARHRIWPPDLLADPEDVGEDDVTKRSAVSRGRGGGG